TRGSAPADGPHHPWPGPLLSPVDTAGHRAPAPSPFVGLDQPPDRVGVDVDVVIDVDEQLRVSDCSAPVSRRRNADSLVMVQPDERKAGAELLHLRANLARGARVCDVNGELSFGLR